MINRYAIGAFISIAIVFFAYILNFYVVLDYGISGKTEVWAHLGDYAGGLLGPIFSFISLVLLIKSLQLQNEANISLQRELKNNEKTEKLRAFESLFFNMMSSQKEMFSHLKLSFMINGEEVDLSGVEAVIELENIIESSRESGSSTESVKKFIEEIDYKDQIFSILRAFYITVKLISEKLVDSQGFNSEDRKDHFLTLINFTDFAQLRLIMLVMQFMEYESVSYLRGNSEFNLILEEVSINYDSY